MPRKIADHTKEDLLLWQRVTSQVTPLRSTTRSAMFSKLNSDVIQSQNRVFKNNSRTKKKMALDNIPLRPDRTASKKVTLKHASPIDLRYGEKAGIDGSTQRRLFRGEVLIDLRLDLHGMTATRAHSQLIQFVASAAHEGCRCVLVITGKGSGILKGHVPDWLKQPPLSSYVLAIAEARPKDGGVGAFYVLLRRKRAAL